MADVASFQDRMASRMEKMKELHRKRNEARQLNRVEVVEEDRRLKEPKSAEAKKRRAQYILEEEERISKCLNEGKDPIREKLRHVGADDAAREARKSYKNPDPGFSSYENASFRKYESLVKSQIKPDMAIYNDDKKRHGEDAFYARAGAMVHGVHKDTPDAIERMASDVENQIKKREKYSRRRNFNDDADIDFINERNMKFNQKLERFYGKYTKDIKDNLERGTAV
ncbi:SYF2 [Lepeophtheirus salmonis]|uniref:Pre-mRNA-splicing factor SYF2 n=1 Tax=Lepeophtheirus salmonis TaxID=72036 RepID=D3PJI2_LEPSM|nr:pre-mRNA-splicing factor SYF2-like [Lepeophtheirus salmonis]ADD38718.1 Pre-mRNA-splicing factor SYF2 [Lepeophtheirus salmonis]CAB4054640.1 SYF2 [Lepeophtheirus salmonis]CAF2760344.1 SYF2 [Lepeophtheirus salmonis]